MGKTKTSVRQRRSSTNTFLSRSKNIARLKKGTGVRESNPTEELANEELISRAVWECLREEDSQGVVEVITAYVRAINKLETVNKSSTTRSAGSHTFKSKNPTIKTLAKLVHSSV